MLIQVHQKLFTQNYQKREYMFRKIVTIMAQHAKYIMFYLISNPRKSPSQTSGHVSTESVSVNMRAFPNSLLHNNHKII